MGFGAGVVMWLGLGVVWSSGLGVLGFQDRVWLEGCGHWLGGFWLGFRGVRGAFRVLGRYYRRQVNFIDS
jgi:hypothetical protein